MTSAVPATPPGRAHLGQWLAGARPRTLPASSSPVLAGTGSALALHGFSLWRAVLCLGVALALQIGVNFANDYSDGIRGTDTDRVGPMRLVASGAAPAAQVKAAAFIGFGVAAVLGLVLAAVSSWWLVLIGVAAIPAAWFYTGGKHPYGYLGLGEVFVFVFFGPVAVFGTTFAQARGVAWHTLLAAVAVGLIACALLVANNLRDIPSDAAVGKRTLSVRIGARRSRLLFLALGAAGLVLGVACTYVSPWALLCLLATPLFVRALGPILGGATGPALIPVLRDTGLFELAFAILLGTGLALSTL